MTPRWSKAQRGLALVSVLWGVTILSLIAATMLTASVTTAYIDRNVWNRTRAASLDDAAVNRAILLLMDDRKHPRVDGAPSNFRFDGAVVRLRIQDEAGRINLNFADKEMLQRLFASAGVARDAAAQLADRVVAHRTLKPGAAIAFRNLDELRDIPGVTPAIYARVTPLITAFGQTTSVDPSVAPREVLALLPDMTPDAITLALKDRAQKQDLPTTSALAIQGSTYTISADATVGGARVQRVAVVQFTADKANPYLFLGWH